MNDLAQHRLQVRVLGGKPGVHRLQTLGQVDQRVDARRFWPGSLRRLDVDLASYFLEIIGSEHFCADYWICLFQPIQQFLEPAVLTQWC